MPVRLKVKNLRVNHPDKPSQRYMGDLLGMTESNYRKLESNVLESIKLDHLDKLTDFFNCNLDEILEKVSN
ncbi:hypothetical protein RIVM261_016240 [Rivularia sp. IAM M-261]|nr:hypothetical protein CAL7716_031340 [Calothrix sp. PCC 7716]GJD16668.1 hypothetical protein RIVM261_016240 [Rivularia sp. IAM M-261]